MNRAKSICRKVGCNNLTPKPGYCRDHEHLLKDRFKGLKKAPGAKEFYSSALWVQTTRAYREQNPLCQDHLDRGMVVKGDLTDHHPHEWYELEAMGENPCDWQWLRTVCHSCHNKKLATRRKRGVPRGT